MARVKDSEIRSAIEMFVNSIYAEKENADWATATEKEMVYAVYTELTNCKRMDFGTWCVEYDSPVNRFDGKDNLIMRIRPLLEMRLLKLAKELPFFTFTPDADRIAL